MIWIIYPRKSKENDKSVSMEMQIDICTSEIKINDSNPIIKVYDADYGISGHELTKRKDFCRAMNDIKNGLAHGIAVYKYDRMARNMYDFVNLYHDIEEAGGCLISATQHIDTSTPAGKQMMYQFAAWAEYEWALNSERRKDANNYAAKKGICNLSPKCFPFGYKAVIVDGLRRMVIDKDQEPIVRDIYEYFSLHKNYKATLIYVQDKYNVNWSKNKIHTIINSSFYHGEYRDNKNYCEPYLTEQEHHDLISSVKRNRVYSDDKRYFLFTGLLECPFCGTKLESQSQISKYTDARYYYYRCHKRYTNNNCSFTGNVNEKKVEKQLIEYIDTMTCMYSAKSNIKEAEEKPKKNYQPELDRLTKAYIKGRLSEEDYDKEYERITELIRQQNNNVCFQKYTDDDLQTMFSSDWKETYNELTRKNKKSFWNNVIRRINFTKDRNIKSVEFL